MEYADLYDEERRPLGRLHLRGTPQKNGEYTMVVCCWICDGKGKILLTRRSPEKESYPGYWENSGGGAQAGETSRQAVAREVREETGICAEEEEFVFLDSGRSGTAFFDFYLLVRQVPLEDVVLQPGETCGKRWATFQEVHEMIGQGLLAAPIARQFLRQEPLLLEKLEAAEA